MLKIILIINFFLISLITMTSDFYNFNFDTIEGKKLQFNTFKNTIIERIEEILTKRLVINWEYFWSNLLPKKPAINAPSNGKKTMKYSILTF